MLARCFMALVVGVSLALVAAAQTTLGHVWTYVDGGKGWIARDVGMGNHGTQVFGFPYLNNAEAVLLSRHDHDPAVPVWTIPAAAGAQPIGVATARDTDVYLAAVRIDTGVPDQVAAEIRRYSSSGLEWTYVHPQPNWWFFLAVSHDGETIVGLGRDPLGTTNRLLVFGPGSPVPVAAHPLPAGAAMRIALSADGARAAVAIQSDYLVLDVATGVALLTVSNSYLLNNTGMALSSDGAIFAAGGGKGTLRIWEWTGAVYALTYTGFSPEGDIVGKIAISEDASTIAYGFVYPWNAMTVRTEALDLPTKAVTMGETLTNWGLWPNYLWDIAISSDGERFVVGMAGDQPELIDEVRIYDKHQDAPVQTWALPGSAMGVDISADGRWVSVGSKATHSWKGGHGGQIDVFHLGGSDLVLTGTPSVGQGVAIELYGAVGAPASLLIAAGAADPPLDVPGVGTLHLDASALTAWPLGVIGPAGAITTAASIPADPGLVGLSVWLQGLTLGPSVLSEDWIKATILP